MQLLPTRQATLLALLSGLLWVFAWPGTGAMWPLGLVAFVPLMQIALWVQNGELSLREGVSKSIITWVIWNAGTLYFLAGIEQSWSTRLISYATPVLINTFLMSVCTALSWFVLKHWSRALGWILWPVLWLAMEWLQHHGSLAFPWLALGNAMAEHTQWVQWYSLTGVAGGTLWIWLVNFAFFFFMQTVITSSGNRRWLVAGLPVGLILLPMLVSQLIYRSFQLPKPWMSAVIIQPCLSLEDEKFNRDEQLSLLQKMLNDAAIAGKSDLVVLPETAIFDPGRMHGNENTLRFSGIWHHDTDNSELLHEARSWLKEHGSGTLISGAFTSRFFAKGEEAPVYAVPVPGLAGAKVLHFNSVVVLDSLQTTLRHKTMLVAGVEQIPLADVFPWMNQLALDLGGYAGSLGNEPPQTIRLSGGIEAAVMICYDSAFGWLSQEVVKNGAEALVVVTNDAWWGDTPGYKQLFSMARLRALETRRPLVRAANNGISAYINAKGEVEHQLPWNMKSVLRIDFAPMQMITMYVRYGDVIYRISAWLVPILLVLAVVRAKLGSRYI
ncbi:MAG: apolipoprotein N-acyltransferase [Cryomorphaceae bacterium]|nr:MAG: apolipoprotein N-acyltransferase [Cryomorphaceae bacterium]